MFEPLGDPAWLDCMRGKPEEARPSLVGDNAVKPYPEDCTVNEQMKSISAVARIHFLRACDASANRCYEVGDWLGEKKILSG